MDGLGVDDPVRVGRYRLLRRLGAGGMGTVYLASGPAGGLVALKVIHASLAREDDFRRRFERETRAVTRVRDRWIAPFEDAGPREDPPWLATRFLPAVSLADAVKAHGPLPTHACWWLLHCLAGALTAVHDAELIHRDLKPANVLLTDEGALLIDFGIAHSPADTHLTPTGRFIGSPGYSAPEILRDEDADGQADVFALGGVLIWAASGNPPFGQGSRQVILDRSLRAEPLTAGIDDPQLRALARACLAKNPSDRPALATVAAAARAELAGRAARRGAWLPAPVHAEILNRGSEAARAAEAPTRTEEQATATAPGPPSGPPGHPSDPPGPPRPPHPPTAQADPRTRPHPTRLHPTRPEPAVPSDTVSRPPRIRRRTVVKASLSVAATVAGGTATAWALRETPQDKALRRQREADAAALAARTVWKAEGAGGHSPAVDRNNVYVPGFDGLIRAVRLSDGAEVWRTTDKYDAWVSPVVLAGGVAAFHALRKTVRALSTDTGEELWSRPAHGSPFVRGDRLYFHDFTAVHCVSPTDGSTIWSIRATGVVNGLDQVHHTDDALAFVTDRNVLTGRSLADDAEPWQRPVSESSTVLLSAGSVMLLAGGRLSVLDAATGATRWTRDGTWASSSHPPAARGTVLHLPEEDRLLALDTARRRQLWSANEETFTIGCVTGDTVYGWGNGGDLVALATADGGQRWRIPGKTLAEDYGTDTAFSVVDDRLYAIDGSRLGCFDTATGRPHWTLRFLTSRAPILAGKVVIGSLREENAKSGTLYALKG
ncbi:protein kinase domain-containing protein (plasmid) [Streptomyces sp. BI20]|uniref:protein kinase domain-containing protein n=1 Tax=Streptomyces sp. BI20 TaxID=3403460 RepID=UPI003C780420